MGVLNNTKIDSEMISACAQWIVLAVVVLFFMYNAGLAIGKFIYYIKH